MLTLTYADVRMHADAKNKAHQTRTSDRAMLIVLLLYRCFTGALLLQDQHCIPIVDLLSLF
jgi:hypothetical protein